MGAVAVLWPGRGFPMGMGTSQTYGGNRDSFGSWRQLAASRLRHADFRSHPAAAVASPPQTGLRRSERSSTRDSGSDLAMCAMNLAEARGGCRIACVNPAQEEVPAASCHHRARRSRSSSSSQRSDSLLTRWNDRISPHRFIGRYDRLAMAIVRLRPDSRRKIAECRAASITDDGQIPPSRPRPPDTA